MADELRLVVNVTHTKAPKSPFRSGTVLIDQSGEGVFEDTVSVGTGGEDISTGDVTPNMVVLANLDVTNYIQVGIDNGGIQTLIRLPKRPSATKAPVPAIFPLDSGATIHAQANNAACNMYVKAWNS